MDIQHDSGKDGLLTHSSSLLLPELGGGDLKGACHTLKGDQGCVHPLLHGLQVVVHSPCTAYDLVPFSGRITDD